MLVEQIHPDYQKYLHRNQWMQTNVSAGTSTNTLQDHPATLDRKESADQAVAIRCSSRMSRELANRIALEAKYLRKLELEKQAECSVGRLYLTSLWEDEEDVEYVAWWDVHKDKDGVLTLSYQHDTFEISQYSPALGTYMANNYRVLRNAFAQPYYQECRDGFECLPVEVCLKFSKAGQVPLLMVSEIEELATQIDTVLRIYNSGRTRLS